DVGVEGQYPLIFVVFNTFFGLPTQEDQIRCFAQVASHLTPDGRFVLEAFVPDLSRYERGQSASIVSLGLERVHLDLARLDPVAQRIEAQHVVITEAGAKLYLGQILYAWASELDFMAQLAP